MAFSYTVDDRILVNGGRWLSYGTWTSTSTTATGDIDVRMRYVETFFLSYTGDGVIADAPSADEVFPLIDTDVTIDFTAAADGVWWCFGRTPQGRVPSSG